ncbi:MAG TPA: hypothetical protein VFE28_11705 [Candidatus Krumholzibacteria bacterium]|nr:hypothetical protein [Candidatus Krumholzibacteria bacterium]
MLRSSSWVRGLIAGLAGGVAWLGGTFLFFAPAQAILGDPARQSAKLLAAFADEPGPRATQAPWLLAVGLLSVGVLWGWVYAWLSGPWSGSWWKRGLRFGVVGWVLMVPWFEFYLPWNVLWEPAALVALEFVCWALVLLVVGLVIAGVEAALRPETRRTIAC